MTYATDTASPDFADYIAAERERLINRKADLIVQQVQLTKDIAAIDAEFEAIHAYEQAKTGHKSNGARAPRASARGKRGEVLELISANNGLGRRQIIDALGARGDKSAEMSISNALTALIKAEQLIRQDGKYFAQAA